MNNYDDNLQNKINSHNVHNLNDFWNEQIWKINTKHIHNEYILNIFNNYLELEKELVEYETIFNIDENYNFTITNDKKNIKKKIYNFKKDKINILKIHSDCFYEYHLKTYEYFKKINFEIINYSNNISVDICNSNLIDKKNIYEHINFFEQKINSNNINSNNIISTLKNNLNYIHPQLIKFIENKSKQILLIDIENILKSFKIQDFIKDNISEKKFNKYYDIWLNGYFEDNNDIENNDIENNDISLSQYSSKTKYIEPYTSLNLNFDIKKKLTEIIIKEYSNEYNIISIITNSNSIKNIISDNNQQNNSTLISQTNINITNENNKMYIKIEYNKHEIREQDDHLLIFLFTLFKKHNIDVKLISGDKFKWYIDYEKLDIHDFKILYNLDDLKKKIIIDKAYTSDIYKINDKYYLLPFINFPIIKIEYYNNKYLFENINFILNKINENTTFDDIENIYKYLFLYSIQNDHENKSMNTLKIYDFIKEYTEQIKNNFGIIFNYLSIQSKQNIFKLSIKSDNKLLIKNDNKLLIKNDNKFSDEDIEKYTKLLEIYKLLVELYQIMKFIGYKYFLDNKEFINKLIIIFGNIIQIYDLMDEHINKIRKLSNSKSNLNKLFSKFNTIYIYIRKQGYYKKNILCIST